MSNLSNTRICKRCGEEYPIEDFYKKKRCIGGRLPTCKYCMRKVNKKYYEANPEPYIERARVQRQTMSKAKRAEYVRNHRKRHRSHDLARQAVHRAVRRGDLAKPSTCEDCLEKKPVEAHHPDYSRPLDVVWVCDPCHKARHKEH